MGDYRQQQTGRKKGGSGFASLLGGMMGAGELTGGEFTPGETVDVPAGVAGSEATTQVSRPQVNPYAVAHPTLDAIFNRGQGGSMATSLNAQQNFMQMQQEYARQLEAMWESSAGQLEDKRGANTMKNTVTQGEEARKTGSLSWEQAEASKRGTDVEGFRKGAELSRPIRIGQSIVEANNYGKRLDNEGGTLSAEQAFQQSPEFQSSYNAGARAQLLTPVAKNVAMTRMEVGPNSVGMIPPGIGYDKPLMVSGPQSSQTAEVDHEEIRDPKTGKVISSKPVPGKVTTKYSPAGISEPATPDEIRKRVAEIINGKNVEEDPTMQNLAEALGLNEAPPTPIAKPRRNIRRH